MRHDCDPQPKKEPLETNVDGETGESRTPPETTLSYLYSLQLEQGGFSTGLNRSKVTLWIIDLLEMPAGLSSPFT